VTWVFVYGANVNVIGGGVDHLRTKKFAIILKEVKAVQNIYLCYLPSAPRDSGYKNYTNVLLTNFRKSQDT
jgi:hypothetical protein